MAMDRVMTIDMSGGMARVTLVYYATGAQSPWTTKVLPAMDLSDPSITVSYITNAVGQMDRQVKAAYAAAGIITTQLGDLLGQRLSI